MGTTTTSKSSTTKKLTSLTSTTNDGSLPSNATLFDKMKRIVTNVFILTVIVLFTIDVAPTNMYPFTYLKQLQNDIDYIMDITGLWQGQWELFSPMPLRVNVRIQAVLLYRYHPYYDGELNLVETTDETNEDAPKLPQTSPEYIIWKSPDWNYYYPSSKVEEENNNGERSNKNEDDSGENKDGADEESCNEDDEDAEDDENTDNTDMDNTNPYGNMTWLKRWRYFRLSEYIDSVRNDNSKALWEPLVERIRQDHPRYITIPTRTTGNDDDDKDSNDRDDNDDSPIIVMYPYKVMLYRLWQYVNDPTPEELELKNLFKPIQKQQLTWQSYMFYTWEDEHHGDNVLELVPKNKKKAKDDQYAIPHDDIPLDKLLQWKNVPPLKKTTVEDDKQEEETTK